MGLGALERQTRENPKDLKSVYYHGSYIGVGYLRFLLVFLGSALRHFSKFTKWYTGFGPDLLQRF